MHCTYVMAYLAWTNDWSGSSLAPAKVTQDDLPIKNIILIFLFPFVLLERPAQQKLSCTHVNSTQACSNMLGLF